MVLFRKRHSRLTTIPAPWKRLARCKKTAIDCHDRLGFTLDTEVLLYMGAGGLALGDARAGSFV